MKQPVFVDTSALYALNDSDDRHHADAVRLLNQLLKHRPRLITSNHVLGESYTVIRSSLGHEKAISFVSSFNESKSFECLFTPHDLELKAYRLLEKYSDQSFSFVDATSFVWMKQLGIREALAFDNHFVTAGFTLLG